MMERVVVRIPEEQLDEIEALIERGRYPNRSEALRAGIRELLANERMGPEEGARSAESDGGSIKARMARGESIPDPSPDELETIIEEYPNWVRSRGQYSLTLHIPDLDAGEPLPACNTTFNRPDRPDVAYTAKGIKTVPPGWLIDDGGAAVCLNCLALWREGSI